MRSVCVFIFFLCLVFFTQAQHVFEHLRDKDGLVSSNVTSILKDSYGFMWFGTYNGLSRYDGYSFVNYQYNPSDSTGIPESYIRCLYETHDKEIYVGFQYKGFAIFDRVTERFIHYSNKKDNPKSLLHDHVLSIYQDSKGNIWIGTRLGLDLFDRATGTFTHFYPFKDAPKPFVTSITEDDQGNLWLSGMGRKVCKMSYHISAVKMEYYIFSNDTSLDFDFNHGSIVAFQNKILYIGTESALYSLQTETFVTQRIELPGAQSTVIMDLMVDSDNRLWVATDGQGVFYKSPEDIAFSVIQHQPTIQTSIGSNAVYAIYESSPGTLWVGTYAAGVSKFVASKHKFKGVTDVGPIGKKLAQKSVLALAEAPDQSLWIGTDGGGLHRMHLPTSSMTYYTTSNSAICGDVVKSIATSSTPNAIWIGTYNKGMCFYNVLTDKSTSFKVDPAEKNNAILRNDVWSLLEDKKKNVWVGTLSGGLNFYDTYKKSFKYFILDSSAYYLLSSSNIFSLMEDSKGRIWIATETMGVAYYDYTLNTFTRMVAAPGTNRLPSNDIRDIFEDASGTIWIATVNSGICKITDIEKQTVEIYGPAQGLNTTHVVGILEDQQHRLWLATDKGISVFTPSTSTFRNYDVSDGLVSKSYNYNSKVKLSNGYLCFGGIGGLTYFHPDSIAYNTHVPPVVLTDFKIFNQSVPPGKIFNNRLVFSNALYSTKEIVLEYSDYVISFEFSALDFTAPEKNMFAYQLQGFEDQWTYVGSSKRFATYTNLAPGEYIFKVKASNNDGLWNEEGLSIRVIVLPPWWMTWWFRLLVGLFVIGGVIGFYYYRFQSIRRRNKELMEEVRLRTKDLEEQQKLKDKFYSILAHDLKNPVSALHVLSEMNQKEQRSTTSIIQKDIAHHIYLSSTRIKDLVLNLLDWIKSQNASIEPTITRFNVAESWKEIIELHKTQASLKQLTIIKSIPTSLYLSADRNMFLTIGRNIFSNAIKYSPLQGTISIGAQINDMNFLEIILTDTGMGFSEDVLQRFKTGDGMIYTKGTQNEMGSGLGLSLAKEFVSLHGGTMTLTNLPSGGGAIYLTIPKAELDTVTTISTLEEESKVTLNINTSTESIEPSKDVQNKYILVVEDDPSSRKAIATLLRPFFSVQEAGSAAEALYEINQFTPDLVISDIQMPGESGIAFCQHFKQNKVTSHIPLILITSETERNYHRLGVEAGADAFIYKPFDTGVFIATISNLLVTIEKTKRKFSIDPLVRASDLTKNADDEAFLTKMIELIEANMDDSELNGDFISTEVGMSRSVLYAKLKSLTGQTISEFIKTIRLKKSATLLMEGKHSIAQIAYMVGFNDPSYFTKVFSKHFGKLPKEFVQENK
ncbi:MAG: response regulator [Cytophagaceae bacterium]|jgi:ligand-binding sensor domain-containing protein/signal transduction histidine kinase/DNA-binding response OmpR family regulator|nr:response regulator [Cytophagaceae bacterium]